LAKGIVLAMESEKSLNDDFNLSTAESTTVLELVNVIWDKINPDQHLEIKNDPGFEYDVNKRVPSVQKARDVLGFDAKTTLSEMLDEVIPWIKSAIQNNTI
jgi:nucleoside-diphosphate-sugar epimerase